MEIKVVTTEDPAHVIQRFYNIMIHAYQVTEVEIWGKNYLRMSPEEFQEVIQRGELIGAWVNDVPVGSIHTYQLRPGVFAFGLFSVDFDYKGQNIGRNLISAAEQRALKEGAKFMELEILRLKNKKLIEKIRLKDWYERLGYELIDTVDFVQRKPGKAEKARNFIAPSVFDCYRRQLS